MSASGVRAGTRRCRAPPPPRPGHAPEGHRGRRGPGLARCGARQRSSRASHRRPVLATPGRIHASEAIRRCPRCRPPTSARSPAGRARTRRVMGRGVGRQWRRTPFHDLRHTANGFASEVASRRELMARMGHSSTRAALLYQHAQGDRERAIGSCHPTCEAESAARHCPGPAAPRWGARRRVQRRTDPLYASPMTRRRRPRFRGGCVRARPG